MGTARTTGIAGGEAGKQHLRPERPERRGDLAQAHRGTGTAVRPALREHRPARHHRDAGLRSGHRPGVRGRGDDRRHPPACRGEPGDRRAQGTPRGRAAGRGCSSGCAACCAGSPGPLRWCWCWRICIGPTAPPWTCWRSHCGPCPRGGCWWWAARLWLRSAPPKTTRRDCSGLPGPASQNGGIGAPSLPGLHGDARRAGGSRGARAPTRIASWVHDRGWTVPVALRQPGARCGGPR